MVFQDASRSLTRCEGPHPARGGAAPARPRHQKAEVERRAVGGPRADADQRPGPGPGQLPHQLSGGLRQRVAIGLAVVTRPALVIADECTTALDVTTQTKVVGLFRALVDELGIGLLFVTHDLMLASDLCDRIAVMSRGRVVEQGGVEDVLDRPRQEYTRRLLAAIPSWT